MREWLSIELLLGVLVTTTFTCISLLALWTATSSRPWFLRVTIAFAILAPLLLVPAYGPLLTFSLVVALVWSGVAIYQHLSYSNRAKTNAKSAAQQSHWQFSVRSSLAVCTCVAVISAVLASTPSRTWDTWPLIALSAILAAVTTLLAALVVCSSAPPKLRIATAAIFLGALTGSGIFCMQNRQPRIPFLHQLLEESFSFFEDYEAALLLVFVGAAFVVTLLTLFALQWAFAKPRQHTNATLSIFARLVAIGWAFLILAPPTLALVVLVRPQRPPDNTLPVPNGYSELVAIGTRFDKSAIETEYWADPVDKAKLFAAVPQYASDFGALHTALKLPFRIPVTYSVETDIDTDGMMALRRLARALTAKGEAALHSGNIPESIACRSDILVLADSVRESGLLIHTLMSKAIEDSSLRGLYKTLPQMTADQCRAAIRELTEFDSRRESWDEAIHREKVWIRKTQGWLATLGFEIQLRSNDDGQWGIFSAVSTPSPQVETLCHLLIAEFAIRAYQLDHGHAPNSRSELVPKYLASFPSDPYDDAGGTLRYSVTNGQPKVWSVGHDRGDDSCKPLPRDDIDVDTSGDGDLWLGDYFKADFY